MDYMKFVEYHRDQGADITVGCLPVDYERASDFGLMNIDNEGVVTVSSACLLYYWLCRTLADKLVTCALHHCKYSHC